MRAEFADTPLGRAARWHDTVTGEHGHQESLEEDALRENTNVLARLFDGTVLEPDDASGLGRDVAANALHVVVTAGVLDTRLLGEMFRGIFITGVCLGARAQAGLHEG